MVAGPARERAPGSLKPLPPLGSRPRYWFYGAGTYVPPVLDFYASRKRGRAGERAASVPRRHGPDHAS
jgi:hypothetical protein